MNHCYASPDDAAFACFRNADYTISSLFQLFVDLATNWKEFDQAARFKAGLQNIESTNVMFCTFALALTVFEIFTFVIFDLEN